MNKLLIGICLLACAGFSYGQEEAPSDSSDLSVNIDLGIATRNVWRGLDYGASPSIWGDFYGTFRNISLGAMGTTTINGAKDQYGTWLELYASYEFKNLTFVIDDYFFFNAEDQDNNYFDYGSENTQHLVEARVEYENDKLEMLTGYVVYSNSEDDTNGVYLEATYRIIEELSFTAGFLTNSQWLSFYDAGGITTLGINGHRKVKVFGQDVPLRASLIFNPNYENASPLVGNNPVYFVLSTQF